MQSVVVSVYERFCTQRFPLPSTARIAEIEKRLGVSLPVTYVNFLLSFNGGYFDDPRLVYSSPGFPPDGLGTLYGIGAVDSFAEFGSDESISVFEDNYPAQVVPIGYSTIGNLIVLVTRDEDRGAILIKRAYEQAVARVASTIEDFFGLVEP